MVAQCTKGCWLIYYTEAKFMLLGLQMISASVTTTEMFWFLDEMAFGVLLKQYMFKIILS